MGWCEFGEECCRGISAIGEVWGVRTGRGKRARGISKKVGQCGEVGSGVSKKWGDAARRGAAVAK